MNVRMTNVPAARRQTAIGLVAIYEHHHLATKKPGKRNGVVWSGSDGSWLVYHTKSGIAVDFLSIEQVLEGVRPSGRL